MHEQLEQRIASWRQGLAEKLGNDPRVLDELEAHLRDEIDKLLAQGQAPEQAFAAAAVKIGAPDKIASEFAKLAAPWWPIRAVALLVALVIAGGIALVGIRVMRDDAAAAPDGWIVIHLAAITVGYLLSYGIGILAVCYACRRMMRELAPGQQTSLVLALVRMGWLALGCTLIGLVTGSVWASDHMGQAFDFWDVRESGALIVVCWQAVLLGSAARANRSLRWLACWGVLGNLAITYAWFIAAVLSNPYAYNPTINLIVQMIVPAVPVLIAIMATALLPSGWLRRLLLYWLANAVQRLQKD